jgi:hypothetical protein
MSVLMSDTGVSVKLWRIPLFMHSAKLKVVMAMCIKNLDTKTNEYRRAIKKLGITKMEDTTMACGKGKKKGGKKGKK